MGRYAGLVLFIFDFPHEDYTNSPSREMTFLVVLKEREKKCAYLVTDDANWLGVTGASCQIVASDQIEVFHLAIKQAGLASVAVESEAQDVGGWQCENTIQ